MLPSCIDRPQVRDGIEEEIAAATKENKRSGRSAKSASAAAAAQKLSAVQVKYSRFDAEVRAGHLGHAAAWAGRLWRAGGAGWDAVMASA